MSKILGRPLYAPAPAGGGKPSAPKFTYDGDYVIRDDGVVELLTSGTLVFLSKATIDLFLVGGGGGGGNANQYYGAGGGGGGYTQTVKSVSIAPNIPTTVNVGAGGSAGSTGGVTSFGDTATANGGIGGGPNGSGGNGGSGGGGGDANRQTASPAGFGGSDGEKGTRAQPDGYPGTGQGTTTREFGEATGKLYSGGGGGGKTHGNFISIGGSGGGGNGANQSYGSNTMTAATNGETNSGGGGGGGCYWDKNHRAYGAPGGSGIVCFRESQELPELAGTWVLNERLYAPEFGPSAIGKQTSQAVTFTAGSDTFTSFVFYWPSVNDNNLYYQNSAKTTVIYNFISNTYYNGVIKTITFPVGATASDEFRAWLASNATKQTA